MTWWRWLLYPILCYLAMAGGVAHAATVTLHLSDEGLQRILIEACQRYGYCDETDWRRFADHVVKLGTLGRESVDTLDATVEIQRGE